MDVLQAAEARRSIRRFAARQVPRDALAAIVRCGYLAPTGTNAQPLQFAAVSDQALCARIFPHTGWALRIPDGSAGPTEATQPRAYIAILVDRQIAQQADTDAGAAGMSMLLAAQSLGVASCWLGSVKREQVLDILGLDGARYALHTLVALGYAAMASRAVPMRGEDTAYYLEDKDALCVPKRDFAKIVHWYE